MPKCSSYATGLVFPMPPSTAISAIASSWPARKALPAEKLGKSAKMTAKFAVELIDIVADNPMSGGFCVWHSGRRFSRHAKRRTASRAVPSAALRLRIPSWNDFSRLAFSPAAPTGSDAALERPVAQMGRTADEWQHSIDRCDRAGEHRTTSTGACRQEQG